MTPSFAFPAGAALAFALLAARAQRRMRPTIAVPLATALAALAAVATAGCVLLVALGWVGQNPTIAELTGWCRHLYGRQREIPIWAGLAAAAALLAMLVGIGHTWSRRRRAVRCPRIQTGELEILPVERPVAFAVPGRPGHIVVSSGMLAALDADERRVLLAHERAHLRCGHHRYVAVAELAAAALPLLRPVAAYVRFGTERWADEEAARQLGDRKLVARAIARAALAEAGSPPIPALALAGLGVPARVEALLAEPPRSRASEITLVAGAGATASSMMSSGWQVHHLLSFALHVCRL